MAHRGTILFSTLALAVTIGFSGPAAASTAHPTNPRGFDEFSVDVRSSAELCADDANFQKGKNAFCKVADESTGGTRPVSAVIDPCTGTVYTGDARRSVPGGPRAGGIRVIQNWFDPGFDPATDDFLITDPNSPSPDQAGKNGIAFVGTNSDGHLVFLTGDRFNGRLYRVTVDESNPANDDWDFIFQAIGDEANGCINPDAMDIDGGPGSDCLGPGVNNLEIDASGRIWFPITTRRGPGAAALSDRRPDGFIQLVEIVGGVDAILNADTLADKVIATEFFGGLDEGFELANGARVDPGGEYLYMAETISNPPRVVRMAITVNGDGDTTLGDPETFVTFPPEDVRWRGGNPGPDEIAFDLEGNLYVMLIFANTLVVIPSDADEDPVTTREAITLFRAPNLKALRDFTPRLGNEAIGGGAFVPLAQNTAFLDPKDGGGGQVDNPTGLAFGGPDLKRIFITTRGQNMYTFQGLVPGMNPFVMQPGGDLTAVPACD